jgi:farnesyl-diphosphate farnesyltransferase
LITTRDRMSAEDWSFCSEALDRHSRTFSIPIKLLPPVLERGISCAYLLCRIADTVEDTPEWGSAAKQQLFRSLQDAVDGHAGPETFVAAVASLEGGDADERRLLLGLGRVLNVLDELPVGLAAVCRDRVGELIGGMMIYSRRPPGPDGIRCLDSMADLDRYCYFVAGVIGRLLTDAFVMTLEDVPERSVRTLRANAENFGAGLQLVNILRDLASDLQRGVCFVPRTSCDSVGLSPSELCDPDHEPQVRVMLRDLFESARVRLDAAFEYTLAIPASSAAIRRFCLVPLWLAVAALAQCQRDPALLVPGKRVKLSRQRVMELIEDCVGVAGDDRELREAFARLKGARQEPALEMAGSLR